jgi:hypothetical protein
MNPNVVTEPAFIKVACRFRWLIAILLLTVLAGCAAPKGSDSSNPALLVQTARIMDIHQHRMIPVNSFSSRERMAALIKNVTSHDQVLQVEFLRQDSGLVLWRNAVTIGRGRTHATGPTAPLPAGTYVVKVTGTVSPLSRTPVEISPFVFIACLSPAMRKLPSGIHK